MTAAARPTTIGGQEYRLSPFSEKDYDELDAWLHAAIMRVARESIAPGAAEEERDEVIGAAVREATKQTFMSRTPNPRLARAKMTRGIWQALRREHPKLTLAELTALTEAHPEDMEEVVRQLADVNGWRLVKKEDDAPQNGAPKA